jgi:hypothetical protein
LIFIITNNTNNDFDNDFEPPTEVSLIKDQDSSYSEKIIQEDLLNLIHQDRFEQKEIDINNKKVKIINLDVDLQKFIWLKQANVFKNNVSKKFKTPLDIFLFTKYERFYKTINTMEEIKINDLNNSNLCEIDKDILRKINE